MDNTVLAFIDALSGGYKPNEDDECAFDCYMHDAYNTGCPFENKCEHGPTIVCLRKGVS